MLFYGVLSAKTEKVVEFFLEREAAEAMISEVQEDEPALAEKLRFEGVSSARGELQNRKAARLRRCRSCVPHRSRVDRDLSLAEAVCVY